MTGSRSSFVSLFGVFEAISFKLFSIIGFFDTIMGKNGGFVEMRGEKFNENFSSKKSSLFLYANSLHFIRLWIVLSFVETYFSFYLYVEIVVAVAKALSLFVAHKFQFNVL